MNTEKVIQETLGFMRLRMECAFCGKILIQISEENNKWRHEHLGDMFNCPIKPNEEWKLPNATT